MEPSGSTRVVSIELRMTDDPDGDDVHGGPDAAPALTRLSPYPKKQNANANRDQRDSHDCRLSIRSDPFSTPESFPRPRLHELS